MQTQSHQSPSRLPLLSDSRRKLLDLSSRPKLGTPRWELDQLRLGLATDPIARSRFTDRGTISGEADGASNGLEWMAALDKDGEKIVVVPVVCVNAVALGNYLWCYSQVYGCSIDHEDLPAQLSGFEGPL